MSPPKKMISLPKYTGAEDDVPVDKWLRLFETKASNATWSERDRIDCISEYLEGEAFRWYLTEIFDSEDSWEGIKTSMIARFSAPSATPSANSYTADSKESSASGTITKRRRALVALQS